MNRSLEQPILGLGRTFPERLWLLAHPGTGRYGCFCHNGVHGLACFGSETAAVRFGEWIDLPGMTTEEVTFDEAREIAKSRPLPVVSLMLLDCLDDPIVHYVR